MPMLSTSYYFNSFTLKILIYIYFICITAKCNSSAFKMCNSYEIPRLNSQTLVKVNLYELPISCIKSFALGNAWKHLAFEFF